MQLRVGVAAAAAQSTAGGTVVTVAGGAAEYIHFSGATGGATERFQWICGRQQRYFSGFGMCSCVVVVAAAAQDTAEGVVVAAAGGATNFPVGLQCNQTFIAELRGDNNDILGER